MTPVSSLVGLVVLLVYFGRGESQTCYDCVYTGNTPSDPSTQKALAEILKLHPVNTQCPNFPYYQSGSIQTLNCNTKNASMYPNVVGGLPYTGWQCQLQTYTMTLKNYANGVTTQVPVTVRGCVPIQWGNPYYQTSCWNIQSSLTNPYVMAILKGQYWSQYNVGAIPGSTTGTYCQCSNNWCNDAPPTMRSSRAIIGVLVAVALSTMVRLLY